MRWVCVEWGQQLIEKKTKWDDIEKMVESMGFSLVPSEKLKFEQDKCILARKKGGKRELQNLRFDVNFQDSGFRRGIFNSK